MTPDQIAGVKAYFRGRHPGKHISNKVLGDVATILFDESILADEADQVCGWRNIYNLALPPDSRCLATDRDFPFWLSDILRGVHFRSISFSRRIVDAAQIPIPNSGESFNEELMMGESPFFLCAHPPGFRSVLVQNVVPKISIGQCAFFFFFWIMRMETSVLNLQTVEDIELKNNGMPGYLSAQKYTSTYVN